MKIKAAEIEERAELRRDIAGEVLAGDGDANDTRIPTNVSARNSRPSARILIILVPRHQGIGRVGAHRRFERQQREPIRRERHGATLRSTAPKP